MTWQVFGTIICSSALFSFIQFLISRHDNKKADKVVQESELAPIKTALLGITQERLEFLLTRHLQAGEVTSNQAKCIANLMKAYDGLGGNDFIHQLYEQFKELPIK